jgi:hypothetical protein
MQNIIIFKIEATADHQRYLYVIFRSAWILS